MKLKSSYLIACVAFLCLHSTDLENILLFIPLTLLQSLLFESFGITSDRFPPFTASTISSFARTTVWLFASSFLGPGLIKMPKVVVNKMNAGFGFETGFITYCSLHFYYSLFQSFKNVFYKSLIKKIIFHQIRHNTNNRLPIYRIHRLKN